MAAFTTGNLSSLNTADAFFQVLRASLTSNGWTEHDVVSDTVGNRNVVFRGSPLDATADNRCFLRWTVSGTTVTPKCYSDYVISTHSGINEAGAAFTLSSEKATYWIRTNGFAVAWCYRQNMAYYKGYAGFVRRGISTHRNGVTKTTAPYGFGVTTMNVASDMTSRLQVGQRVQIANYSHINSGNVIYAEYATIQSIASGSITFEGPTGFSYDTGALIGWNALPCMVIPSFAGDSSWGAGYASRAVDGYGFGATGISCLTDSLVLAWESSADPNDVSLEYAGGFCPVTYSATGGRTAFLGYLYHWEAMSQGTQLKEDIMYDGTNSFVVLMLSGITSVTALGPM
jgi:hypothetical protein